MLKKKLGFEIYADYHQFYLEDEKSPHKTKSIWNKETHEQMLAIEEGLVAVGTARYETVAVYIEIYDSIPFLGQEKYSRINECSLKVTSGKLVISNCTEYLPKASRIDIEPAIYRVRILYGNLETVKNDWEGDDHYILQLWKDSSYKEMRRIKP